MHQPVITTPRLDLHHIPVAGLIDLFEASSDVAAIAGRNITNPHRNLLKDQGPLPWRVPQVKANPEVNKWFVRFIVLRESGEIIGSTSFHGAPDENGMMEIGLGIEENFRRRGLAREALLGMWRWVCTHPEVKVLRYTVSASNLPSIALVQSFDFTRVGEQMDEIDGPEEVYEMSASEFQKRWGVTNV